MHTQYHVLALSHISYSYSHHAEGLLHPNFVVEHTQESCRKNTFKNEILQKNRKIPFLVNFWPILATFYEVKITF
jgi:hypothetical protein